MFSWCSLPGCYYHCFNNGKDKFTKYLYWIFHKRNRNCFSSQPARQICSSLAVLSFLAKSHTTQIQLFSYTMPAPALLNMTGEKTTATLDSLTVSSWSLNPLMLHSNNSIFLNLFTVLILQKVFHSFIFNLLTWSPPTLVSWWPFCFIEIQEAIRRELTRRNYHLS